MLCRLQCSDWHHELHSFRRSSTPKFVRRLADSHCCGRWVTTVPPRQPQAGAARASVLWHTGTNRVGAVAADEPPILIGDHRPELDSCYAVWAANNQSRVGSQRALLHTSKGDWHAGSQTPRRVIPLKTKGSCGNHTSIEPKPAPTFRQACRQAGQVLRKLGHSSSGFPRYASSSGTVWSGQRSAALGIEAGRARRKEREEASGHCYGEKVSSLTASFVDKRRSLRTAAQQRSESNAGSRIKSKSSSKGKAKAQSRVPVTASNAWPASI